MMQHEKLTRRQFVSLLGAGAALSALPGAWSAEQAKRERIKAFCIDFNWLDGKFAKPGVFAKASPREHLNWYREMGVNTIQTFCVNCCGYAWYRGSKVAPVTPGLASDFLPEITKLAHGAGMKSMGYFCVGANTWWGEHHPDLSHGAPPSAWHIPFTKQYVDYLSRSIEDSVRQTGIDGFMIDWVFNTPPGKEWMACEKEMYVELLGEPFPGEAKVTKEQLNEYGRRAVARAWKQIHQTTKAAKSDAIIWLSCHDLKNPHVAGSAMLRELDWIMNENPDTASLEQTRKAIGPQGKIVQAICGWGEGHNAQKIVAELKDKDVGFYGFAAPDPVTTLPPEAGQANMQGNMAGNAKNIAFMRKAFHEF